MSTPYTGGVTVSFNSSSIATEITRITVNQVKAGSNRQRVSTAHLGSPMTQGTVRLEEPYVHIWQPQGGGGGNSMEIEAIGSLNLTPGETGVLNISGPVSLNATAATVANSVISGSVGDLVRFTAQIVW